MNIKEKLIEKLRKNIEIISKSEDEYTPEKNCPSDFGLQDDVNSYGSCNDSCIACWTRALED